MYSSNKDVKLVQESEHRIFQEVKDVLKKYDLRYYALGGTLIGAIRHEGFVPWDDDIDLAMPRPDYEKFLTVVEKELSPRFRLQNYKTNEAYNRYVTRVCDKRTVMSLDSYETGSELEVWLDIFPLDGTPNGILARSIHLKYMYFVKGLTHISSLSTTVNKNRPGRPVWQQLIINFFSVVKIEKILDSKKLLDWFDSVSKKYEYDCSEYIVVGSGVYGYKKELHRREELGAGQTVSFEDEEIRIPSDYDAILRRVYGDYMQLPPENKREIHHIRSVRNVNENTI